MVNAGNPSSRKVEAGGSETQAWLFEPIPDYLRPGLTKKQKQNHLIWL